MNLHAIIPTVIRVFLECHENSDSEKSDLRPRKLRPLEIKKKKN